MVFLAVIGPEGVAGPEGEAAAGAPPLDEDSPVGLWSAAGTAGGKKDAPEKMGIGDFFRFPIPCK